MGAWGGEWDGDEASFDAKGRFITGLMVVVEVAWRDRHPHE